jgi:hypothetical protein
VGGLSGTRAAKPCSAASRRSRGRQSLHCARWLLGARQRSACPTACGGTRKAGLPTRARCSMSSATSKRPECGLATR